MGEIIWRQGTRTSGQIPFCNQKGAPEMTHITIPSSNPRQLQDTESLSPGLPLPTAGFSRCRCSPERSGTNKEGPGLTTSIRLFLGIPKEEAPKNDFQGPRSLLERGFENQQLKENKDRFWQG